jgi:hypothetical protein
VLQKTYEEKSAIKIINMLNDFTLDAKSIGYYLARVAPKTAIDRMSEVYSSAQAEYARIEAEQKLREEYKRGNTLI